MILFGLLFLLVASVLQGQGTRPKDSPTSYPASQKLPDHAVAAEYMVHSIGNNGTLYVARDFLVVEAAIFPKLKRIPFRSGQFLLRVNHKATLAPQTPPSVAASLNHPSDDPHPHLETSAGVGDVQVTSGRPMETGRFPGDPRGLPRRLPRPSPEEADGLKGQPESLDEFLERSALPEGEWSEPKAGLLFFYFRGKTKHIKSLELVYTYKGEEVSLELL